MIFRILQWGIGALVMAALLIYRPKPARNCAHHPPFGGATDPQTLPLYVIILALFITGHISALLSRHAWPDPKKP